MNLESVFNAELPTGTALEEKRHKNNLTPINKFKTKHISVDSETNDDELETNSFNRLRSIGASPSLDSIADSISLDRCSSRTVIICYVIILIN